MQQQQLPPTLSAKLDTDSFVLRFTLSAEPLSVRLWRGHNPTSRDFRWATTKIPWFGSDLPTSCSLAFLLAEFFVFGLTVYCHAATQDVTLTPEKSGFTAYFIEATFSSESTSFSITSDVYVFPNVLQYPPCAQKCECRNSCS
jgi:PhoPQ-activated pathogenicity-related protein